MTIYGFSVLERLCGLLANSSSCVKHPLLACRVKTFSISGIPKKASDLKLCQDIHLDHTKKPSSLVIPLLQSQYFEWVSWDEDDEEEEHEEDWLHFDRFDPYSKTQVDSRRAITRRSPGVTGVHPALPAITRR